MKSIISDDVVNVCYLCKIHSEYLEEHHIFEGTGRRKVSDSRGMLVHLCRNCHRKIHEKHEQEMELKELGQRIYEEQIGTREEFIREFIRSYL